MKAAEKTHDAFLRARFRAAAPFFLALAILASCAASSAMAARPPHSPLNAFWAEYYEKPSISSESHTWSYPSREPSRCGFEKTICLVPDAAGKVPGSGIPSGRFMARWTGYFYFTEDREYEFDLEYSDGVRFLIDDQMAFERWRPGPAGAQKIRKRLYAGWHKFRVKHFNAFELPLLKLSWTPPATEVVGRFGAEFFDNMSWKGAPCYSTIETEIMHDYAYGAPYGVTGTPGLGGDNAIATIDYYSARWRGLFYFNGSAQYKFFISSDNLGRLFVDGELAGSVDWWEKDSKSPDARIPFSGKYFEHFITAGTHEVRFDWFEDVGDARAFVKWWKNTPPAGASIRAVSKGDTDSVELALSARDSSGEPGGGVAAYCIREKDHAPDPGHSAWISVEPPQPEFSKVLEKKLPAPGEYEFFAWFRDARGSVSAPASVRVIFRDVEPPAVTAFRIGDARGSVSSEIALAAFGVSDNHLVTHYSICVVPDGAPSTAREMVRMLVPVRNGSETCSIRMPGDGGTCSVVLKLRDMAGNESPSVTREVYFAGDRFKGFAGDREPPSNCSVRAIPSKDARDGRIRLELRADDAGSMVSSYAVSVCVVDNDEPEWKEVRPERNFREVVDVDLGSVEGELIVKAWFRDRIGNVSGPVETAVTGIDLMPPAFGTMETRIAGKRGFVPGGSFPSAFALIRGGTVPVVAFADPSLDGKLTVVEFLNGTWSPLGSPGISAGCPDHVAIGVHNGLPIVVFTDSGVKGRLRLMAFNGEKWESVTRHGIPDGPASHGGIASAPGEGPFPYIYFSDDETGGRLTVMRYAGGMWTFTGSRGFSAEPVEGPVSFAADRNMVCASFVSGGLARTYFFDGARWSTMPRGAGPYCNASLSAVGFHDGRPLLALSGPSSSAGTAVLDTSGEVAFKVEYSGLLADMSFSHAGSCLFLAGRDPRAGSVHAFELFNGSFKKIWSDDSRFMTWMAFDAPWNAVSGAKLWTLLRSPADDDGLTLSSYSFEKRDPWFERSAGGGILRFSARDDGSGISSYSVRCTSPAMPARVFELAGPVRSLEAGVPFELPPGYDATFEVTLRDGAGNTSLATCGFAVTDLHASGAAVAAADGDGIAVSSVEVYLDEKFSVPASGKLPLSGNQGIFVRAVTRGDIPGALLAMNASSEGYQGGIDVAMERQAAGGEYRGSFRVAPSLKPAEKTLCARVGDTISIRVPSSAGGSTVRIAVTGEWAELFDRPVSDGPVFEACLNMFNMSENASLVAYSDGSRGGRLSAATFTERDFSHVGLGVSDGAASHLSMTAFNNEAFIAFSDGSRGGRASLMKYSSGAWTYLGGQGFTDGPVSSLSLGNYRETPYLAFIDMRRGGRASVMKLKDATWEYLQSPGFTKYPVDSISLSVAGDPHVAFPDASCGGRLSVMRFSGNSTWEYLGKPGFSAGEASRPSIFLYKGVPFVAFIDEANGGRASVMRFSGGSWGYAGKPGFTGATVRSLSFYAASGEMCLAVATADGALSVNSFDGEEWRQYPVFPRVGGTLFEQSMFAIFSTPYVAYGDPSGGRLRITRIR